jgi:hypothetical protein
MILGQALANGTAYKSACTREKYLHDRKNPANTDQRRPILGQKLG